jgi:hypothetical protein
VEFEAVYFTEYLASRISNKKEQMVRNMVFCISAGRLRSKKISHNKKIEVKKS